MSEYRLITAKEAARILGLGKDAFSKIEHCLPKKAVGKRWRYPLSGVIAYSQEDERPARPAPVPVSLPMIISRSPANKKDDPPKSRRGKRNFFQRD